ncbi:MAG: hypothetical protein IKJ83_00245 [Ruminococcus sp.]|nr:hypothetical protein [Ruminococcus sp.]
MKKNILCIILLLFSLTTFIVYSKRKEALTDSTPPVLYCDSDTITAKVEEITDDFLLSGVTAKDDRCGDVTDSIVVQSISNFIKENRVIVTYAAVDDSNNVGRLERTLIYENYTAPKFSLDRPLLYPVGTNIKFLNNIHATSSIDGDISTQIRYGLENLLDNNAPASYPIEFRVTDSNGKTSYLNTHVVIYNNTYTGIDINLKKYIVYIRKDSEFTEQDAIDNIKSISEEVDSEPIITFDVDTKTPGTYYVDYKVHSDNASGMSRLIVVVED